MSLRERLNRALRRPWKPTYGRRVLEEQLLPALANRDDLQRLLFVGCSSKTRRYPSLFAGREFWTIDIDPSVAKFGSRRHVVGSFADVRSHFEPDSLDAVICIGVYGWGLDDPAQIGASIDGTADCLRPGGLFVIGWNDIEGHREEPEAAGATDRFERVAVEPFGLERYPTYDEMRLTFEFFELPRGQA